MDRVKNTSVSRFIYSVLLNVAILLISILVFIPFFEENDDTHIAMIAEGAYGNREWHLIYENVILGKLYSFLYSIFSNVRWHTVLQYMFIFLAYVSVTYVISKHKHGITLSLIAVLATFYELYVSLQYTKTAAFLCGAGILLFYEFVRDGAFLAKNKISVLDEAGKNLKVERAFYLVFGFIYIVYGTMLRPEGLLFALVPLCFIGLLELVRTRQILQYLVAFVPTFIVLAGVLYINNSAYKNNSEWAEFMDYNKARMQLTDYRYDILYYPDNGEKLKEIGVSENDALIIVTYQFGDDNIITTDYMKNISATFGKKPFTFKVIRMLWGNILEEISRVSVELPVLICLIALLISVIVVERSRSNSEYITDATRKFYTMAGMGIICSAAIIYFQYSGRWSHRLVAALFIPTIFGICYMLDGGIDSKEGQKIIFGGNFRDRSMLILGLSLAVSIGFNVYNYTENIKEYNNVRDEYSLGKNELKHISEDKDTLYVFDTFTFQNSFKYDVFDVNRLGEFDNFVSCGSWFMNSPITKKVCEKYGYTNPYDALINNGGNAVLIDNYYPEEKALFLSEHYDRLYKSMKTESYNGFDEYIMEQKVD